MTTPEVKRKAGVDADKHTLNALTPSGKPIATSEDVMQNTGIAYLRALLMENLK
ncbi:MAG: hypothetical protein SFV17_10365 [Candidatus Obscuribacter sp.]|jgi:hypothetical protein|nr:hypothetical protein [Candidatus Obscuribacter sp.]